jgi:predicted ATP-binding protein involved in virulence
MFLKNIELINFKCHTHLKIDFSTDNSKQPIRKTTFLLGENGTGKSAVLKAIALVTAGSNALAGPDVIGNPDSWIQNKKKFCQIMADIVTAEGEERHIELKIKRGSQIREILHENQDTLGQLDDAIKNADRNYFILAYGASRRLNRGENKLLSKESFLRSPRSAGIISLFNPDATLISLTSWAMDIDYSSKGKDLGIVKTALNQFLVENVKFKKIDRQKGQMIFSTPDGDVPLEQLSDGYQNVTAWVGDMMYNITNSFRNYKEPLKARGVLLIDEVDLHLHPKWQRTLHAFLESKLPNFQIIVTTHSPLTAQQAKENELYALRRTKKDIELVAFTGDPSKMLLHQILMSPVFGVESDESVEVEKTKKKVRELTLKKSKTTAEKAQVKQLSAKIADLPMNVRPNSSLDKKDVKLLKTLNQKLKANLQ